MFFLPSNQEPLLLCNFSFSLISLSPISVGICFSILSHVVCCMYSVYNHCLFQLITLDQVIIKLFKKNQNPHLRSPTCQLNQQESLGFLNILSCLPELLEHSSQYSPTCLPYNECQKKSAELTRSTFLFCCSRILLQPDDSLQILAPVEADVGFYTCNATNALGYDSVSIAVTLAGNLKTSIQFYSEIFMTGCLQYVTGCIDECDPNILPTGSLSTIIIIEMKFTVRENKVLQLKPKSRQGHFMHMRRP